ncbi:hypothetical protein RRG08_056020 [Elysia crispata]|uniref:Uncharacterized protein n=1 Tax=Elysia crispata TaxID=231223 RepID=A0AAE1AGB2_9GAST|nr:hypothetical protein RRG08_056020 [Elysia crispata]
MFTLEVDRYIIIIVEGIGRGLSGLGSRFEAAATDTMASAVCVDLAIGALGRSNPDLAPLNIWKWKSVFNLLPVAVVVEQTT